MPGFRPSPRSPRTALRPPTFPRHGANGERTALGEKIAATFRDVERTTEN
ncbi:hypothetical protein ACWD6P_14830 [Streptomyces sp. NPDC002446]